MPLNIPDGEHCFVDATILHYALVPTFDASPLCLAFLDRAIAGLITTSVSSHIVSEVLHKVMTSEAAELTGRDRASMVGYLKKHPEVLSQLVAYPKSIESLSMVPLQMLPVDLALLHTVPQIAQSYGLLTNDAIIVALMQRHGLTHIATNDDDFDRVPGITVWKPRV